jgi:diguanylate cyclase (GGDEF)-like protein/PAS domain S-box-containing protein
MKTVLIVDDNKEDLRTLKAILEGHGYKVASAGNGVEALKAARKSPPDVILSDILMPVMDGFALCREWKRDRQLKTIPFVFYTSVYTDADDQKLALELGAERFIAKPIAPEELARMVKQVLAEPRQCKPTPSEGTPPAEAVVMQKYNEALIHKIEENVTQLEGTTRVLEQEVTEHRQAEEALRSSETRYRRLFEAAQDGILILDAESGAIADANAFLMKMLGYSHEELVGKTVWEIGPFKDTILNREAFRKLQNTGYVRYEHLPLESKDGCRVDVEFVSNVYLVNGERVIQCNIRDITERRRTEEKLLYLGTHDTLTGVYNRAYFEEEFERLKRGRGFFPVSIVMVDVDGMKAVNDSLGHAVGDAVLQTAAVVLASSFRSEDVVARIGGDEFAVLLPASGSATAEKAVTRVRRFLSTRNSRVQGPLLSLSIGTASGEKGCSLSEVLREADENMYREKQAKKAGARNASAQPAR